METAGKMIRDALRERGKGHKDLAAACGVSLQTVRNNLSRDGLSFKTAQKYAGALNCHFVLQDKETGEKVGKAFTDHGEREEGDGCAKD